MKNSAVRLLLVCAVSLGLTTLASAQQLLGVGDSLPALHLADQHDQPYAVPADTRRVLLVADNGGTALATRLIEAQDADWLVRGKQVLLADIHKMPGFVARFIAIPQLQKKPYPIALGRDAADLRMFPRKKDCVSVMTVNDGKIADVSFACSSDELQAAASAS